MTYATPRRSDGLGVRGANLSPYSKPLAGPFAGIFRALCCRFHFCMVVMRRGVIQASLGGFGFETLRVDKWEVPDGT